ncbi:MAG: cysteine--tRNA ligase, partial [Spirochaetaceae bacterium]|nr:cysteine--tRNA ligase [Spirochaetaceae bacterium]
TFSWDALSGARNARAALDDRVTALARAAGDSNGTPVDEIGDAARIARDAMIESISDDMNIPKALGELWTLIKDDSVPPADRLGVVLDMDRVLGLRLSEASAGGAAVLPEDLAALISEREQARVRKDFARADELRDELRQRGVLVEDTASGTKWKLV